MYSLLSKYKILFLEYQKFFRIAFYKGINKCYTVSDDCALFFSYCFLHCDSMTTNRLEPCIKLPLENEILEDIVDKAKDWALMHGQWT